MQGSSRTALKLPGLAGGCRPWADSRLATTELSTRRVQEGCGSVIFRGSQVACPVFGPAGWMIPKDLDGTLGFGRARRLVGLARIRRFGLVAGWHRMIAEERQPLEIG